jgi:hypothetical protein
MGVPIHSFGFSRVLDAVRKRLTSRFGEAASLSFARISKSRFSCSTAGAARDVFVTAFMVGLEAFFLGTGIPHAVAALVCISLRSFPRCVPSLNDD